MQYKYITEYYEQIQKGEAVVGKWIKLIYEYVIGNLDNGIYFYDEVKATNVVDWVEANCRHTEGPLAPGLFLLEPWQKALIGCLYGIVDNTGNRQFRECVLIVARKNGKSLLASALGRYEWLGSNEYGSRVFCVAPKLDQTDIIYNSVWNMTTLDPSWQELKDKISNSRSRHGAGIDDAELPRHTMTDLRKPSMNAIFKKLAFSSKKSDGFNPSMVICDEIASWEGDKGLKQYEVMKSGMGARPQPILFSCSTSGYINESIYDEIIKRATRVLLGDSKETRLLPMLYMIDDIEKWNDIEELKKSNPNLGVSVPAAYLEEEIAIAEGSLSKKAEFICKYCNLKQNSSQAWLSSKVVNMACGDPLTLEQFRSSYCVAGIDLSQTTDLTCACVVIERDEQLYVISKFFMPEERIDEAAEREGVPYRIYVQRGLIQPSGDNFVDYHDVYDWLTMLVEEYEILPLMVGYDRYSAQYLIQDLKAYGFRCDDVFQGTNLYPIICEFEGSLKDGRIHIGDNDLMKMHMLNSAIKMDVERGRGRLIKMNPTLHIDGVAALLDAMTVRAKYHDELGDQLQNL